MTEWIVFEPLALPLGGWRYISANAPLLPEAWRLNIFNIHFSIKDIIIVLISITNFNYQKAYKIIQGFYLYMTCPSSHPLPNRWTLPPLKPCFGIHCNCDVIKILCTNQWWCLIALNDLVMSLHLSALLPVTNLASVTQLTCPTSWPLHN